MADPYCLAMVLCDAVHRDPATQKFTLLGTFSNIGAPSFPAQVHFSVYFAVTDGLGPTKFRLQLIKASAGIVNACSDEPEEGRVFLTGVEVDLASPLMVLESVFFIGVSLPEPGLYHCELWANTTVLMSRRVTATRIELPDRAQENENP